MVGTSHAHDAPVLAVGVLEDILLQAVPCARVIFPVEQEAAELVGPDFAALLEEELQLAQKVLVAQGVEGVVFEVGFPEVVDEPGEALGQDAERVHGLGSAIAVHAKEGQKRSGGDMKPMQLACDAQSAFIGVDRRSLGDCLDNGPFHRGERFAGTGVDGDQCSQAQGLAKEILAHLPQPVEGKDLLVGKIEHQTPEVRAVLDGVLDVGGECGAHAQSGDRAAFDFGLVFGHLQTQRREVKNLAALVVEHGCIFQTHPAA